jgi:hypothetical protein
MGKQLVNFIKFNRCDKSMRNTVVLEHETYISHVIRGLMR